MKKLSNIRLLMFYPLILSFLILNLVSCGGKSDNKQSAKTEFTDTVSVEITKVAMQQLTSRKTFSATLEGEEQANVYAKIPERITKIETKVGNYVTSGSLLFELDKGGSAAQFYQAKAAYLNAEKNYERMKNLLKAGAISQQAFDAAETQYEVSKANFDASKSVVEITSPLAGIVTAINVNLGDLSNPQMPLATVANIGKMKAKFNVGENDITTIYVGQHIQVYTEADPGKIQTGKITQISRSANIQSRTFEVQAIFPNTNDKFFKPGMFCTVSIELKTANDVFVIPASSIVDVNNEKGVYLVKDNKAYFQTVNTGLSNSQYTEVTSGLNAGETIVSVGMSYLKNGTVVIVSNK